MPNRGRKCSICSHPRKLAINREIVRGNSESKIADQFDVSKSALGRHRRGGHLDAQLKRAAEREALDADSLLEDLITLRAAAVGLMNKAEKAGSFAGAASALNAAHRVTETMAKMIDALAPAATVNVLQIEGSSWVELRSKILTALEPYPEAQHAVLEALGGQKAITAGEVVNAEDVEVIRDE
jgi:hypothetical protein